MPDPLRYFGALQTDRLTAAANDRILPFLLLPYGEPGSTNKGKLTASRGSVELPADPSVIHANFQHDPTRPLGKAVSLEDTDAGILASFEAADTQAGRDWVTEARTGLRTGISVELADPVIRAGKLLKSKLSGAGAVVRPAFDSAQLVTAADAGTVDDALQAALDALDAARAAVQDAADANNPTDPNTPNDPATPPAAPAADDPTKDKVTAAMTPPATPAVPPLLAGHTSGTGPEDSASALYAALAARRTSPDLLAAFSTVSEANVFDVATPPAYVGEITAASPYKRKYADLIINNPLTGPKVQGWRFVEGKTPIVSDYAGNFAEIASNPVQLEEVSFDAGRVAGGNKVDRIHYDFPTAGFWAGYLRESTSDYDRKTDAKVLAAILAGGSEVLAGAVPAGVAAGWAKVVDGALAIWDFAVPTFALVGNDLYREMALTSEKDKLAFLNASLGMDEAQAAGFIIRPVGDPSYAGKVKVGAKAGFELQELPGLIRVSALDVSHAATDEGVYGYNGVYTRDARAVVTVVDVLTAP